MSARRITSRIFALAVLLASLTACESVRGYGNSDGGGVRSGGFFRF